MSASNSPPKIACPHCQALIKSPALPPGSPVNCPKCGQAFRLGQEPAGGQGTAAGNQGRGGRGQGPAVRGQQAGVGSQAPPAKQAKPAARSAPPAPPEVAAAARANVKDPAGRASPAARTPQMDARQQEFVVNSLEQAGRTGVA